MKIDIPSLKWRIVALAGLVFLPMLLAGTFAFYSRVVDLEVRTAVNGLMNFADAKQHGVIRFIDQNRKLSRQLARLVEDIDVETARKHFATVVSTDVYDLETHPFKDEIARGTRGIATTATYHAIDFVRNDVIEFSSDPKREGRRWTRTVDAKLGYGEVFLDEGTPALSFASPSGDGMVYVHADARMLTLIVNGEIGNMAGIGAFYLAGVGKTFDYYIVNRDNLMITESRAIPDALLKRKGSEFPWNVTRQDASVGIVCNSKGVYVTNVGCTTGCREAMGFYEGRDGTRMLGASMPFYDTGWTIVVEQQADELLGPLYALRNVVAGSVVLLCVISMAIFGYVIQRYIARPLNDVQYVVKGLVDGDLTRRLHSDRNDEVGQLVRGIEAMREQYQITLDRMREAIHVLSSETSMERLRVQVTELLGAITGATAVSVVTWSEELRGWCFMAPVSDGDSSELIPVDEAGARGLLPLSVLRSAERTSEPLLLDDAMRDARFASDPYFAGQAQCSLLLVPINSKGAPRAILLLENRLTSGAFSAHRLDAVMLIAGQLAVSMDNAQLYERLEQRVLDRTRELREAQSQLLGAARLAGMAEIATNVLHNVGNVLTSINISAEQVIKQLRTSKLKGLTRAVQLMDEHADHLGDFLTSDAKGRLLPAYLRELGSALAREQNVMEQDLIALGRSVDHVSKIVATQQSYAGESCLTEPVRIADLIDDALRINAGALQRHKVEVVRELEDLPALPLDRHRLLQILVNLIANAKQAMSDVSDRAACITLAAHLAGTVDAPVLRISVTDNGEGIAEENLTRIFSHGFSTREDGHGFGLHSCILAAQEMGGTLRAHSEGPGHGATFTLDIPCAPREGAE